MVQIFEKKMCSWVVILLFWSISRHICAIAGSKDPTSSSALLLQSLSLTPAEDDDLSNSNQETVALKLAFADHKLRQSSNVTEDLLCVSFLLLPLSEETHHTKKSSLALLMDNIKVMGSKCRWAVYIYQAKSTQQISSVCELKEIKARTVFCGAVAQTLLTLQKSDYSTPLILLYREVLPLSLKYRRLLILSADSSLAGFDAVTYLQTVRCSFFPHAPPLIAQPLIEHYNWSGKRCRRPYNSPPVKSPLLSCRARTLSSAAVRL